MEITKENWEVSSKSFGGCDTGGNIVIRSPNGLVAMACTIHEGLVNAEANARLIAQSPRMAEWIAKVARQDSVVFPEDKKEAKEIIEMLDLS